MAELSKLKKDDEDNFYIVPISKEREFDLLMYEDAEDWTDEERATAESFLINGDYETVEFMWPIEPTVVVAENEICAVFTVKGVIGEETAEVSAKYYPRLSDDRWEQKVETTAAHAIMRDIMRATN